MPSYEVPAFTEFLDFTFAERLDLEDSTKIENQIWATTVQTYINHPGTATVWWARVIKSQRDCSGTVLKLIVDWNSSHARDNFLSSPTFTDLRSTWQSSPSPYSSSHGLLFDLGYNRLGTLRVPGPYTKRWVTVLLHFKFSRGYHWLAYDPVSSGGTRESRWSSCWFNVSHAALQSRGGVITSCASYGWTFGRYASFLGLLMFIDLESAEEYLNFADNEEEGRLEWGLPKLRELADGGTECEIVRFMFESKKIT